MAKSSEDPLEIVDRLLKELKSLPNPTPAQQKKLDNKYRLEWNFHSNRIEGNTLTYGQTELLLFRGKATGNHDKQEYDEMEAHDVAIEMVKNWAKEEDRDITEADIRELNKIILVRPFWKEAITPDGQRTRKQIQPGAYKSSPNSVRLKNGQIHDYASPEETPALMQDLFKWYKDNENAPPLIKSAVVHHRLTQIHPFDDGNGRVARLWANFILLKAGFTPLIIRTESKEDYLTALAQADAGDIEPFVNFLAVELQWSLELAIKAAKGKPVEEPGDLEKKIALLKEEVNSLKVDEAKTQKNPEVISEFVHVSLLPLGRNIDLKLNDIKTMFNGYEISVYKDGTARSYKDFATLDIDEAINFSNNEKTNEISLEFWMHGFKKAGIKAFSEGFKITVHFKEWTYEIQNSYNNLSTGPWLYDNQLDNEEIQEITNKCIDGLIDDIQKHVKSLKK
jgi:Fic family protein